MLNKKSIEEVISKKTLKSLDKAVKNMAKGKVSKPVNMEELKVMQQRVEEIERKKALRALLRKRGWSPQDIKGTINDLWPDN